MLLREVEYARPASVQEALRLLGSNEGARALAGGQTLINVMKARAASPDVLVDLADIGELRGIELGSDGTLTIGAMTTYTDIVDSAEARARPILGEVCNQIADVQVRNRGTVGGNVCSNDPTNHLPPLLVAVGATMTILGQDGERSVPAREFFLGVYMTAAGPGELLTKISVPPGKGDGFASVPIGRDGTCIVNVAASLDGGGGAGGRRRWRSAASTRCRLSSRLIRPRRTRCAQRSAAPTSIRPPTCTPRRTTGATSPKFSPYARSPRPQEGTRWKPSRAGRSLWRSTACSASARSKLAACSSTSSATTSA
jgi:carbon-monoxide dehydrogenase medium subunit